jgi:negative regulator of flagellin synthesis FlgM
MDIQSGFEGLKSILGVSQPAPAAAQEKGNVATGSSALGSDQATLSNAGSAVALGSGDSSVRMDKVASIQAALAAGTYNVSASALASKLVDTMMGGGAE